jgi:hypothetical protein
LIAHWIPVLVSPSSRWMFGAAIETIVWSMNIIATAKIIAARTRFLDRPRVACVTPASAAEAIPHAPLR